MTAIMTSALTLASLCAGCGQSFTYTGLFSHLARTSHSPCLAFRDKIETQVDEIDTHSTSDDVIDEGSDNPTFQGDFFGDDYTSEDFEWKDDDEVSSIGSNSSDNDEESEEEILYTNVDEDQPTSPSISPFLPAPAQTTHQPQTDPDTNAHESSTCEEGSGLKPIITKFGGRAGECLHSTHKSQYSRYMNSEQGEPVANNP